jgi:hypothetical protein
MSNKGGDIMENIQRHTDCDNFQMPECPHYENVRMKEAYLIKEGVANYSSNISTMNYVKIVMNSLLKLDNLLTPTTDQ